MTDPRDRVTRLCQELVGALPLVHLSFSDGIGVASEALRRINNNVLFTLSWKIDPACIQFVTQTFSSVPMRDVAEFDSECVVQHIEAKLQGQQYVMVITAGPPCPDFSSIRDNPKGTDGTSGWLFKHMLGVEHQLRKRFRNIPIETVFENVVPHPAVRDNLLELTTPLAMAEHQLRKRFRNIPIETVFENVVPHPAVRDNLLELTTPLAMAPIVVDASDSGLIHRKRLWWTTIPCNHIDEKLPRLTPWSLTWNIDDGWNRLHNPIAAELQQPIITEGYSLPHCLQNDKKLFHCLATPAPSDQGRTEPRQTGSRTTSMEAWHRWEQDRRRCPPWQYESQFLVTLPDGSMFTAPVGLREQLQGLPLNYTATLDAGNDNRRSVALGNAWHLPTAIWILFLLLLGTVDATIPATPRTSALQHVTNFWLQRRVPFGPPPRGSCHDYLPQFSWTELLDWALARETHMSPKTLDPTLSWCIKHRHLFHPLEDFQNAVISDIQDLVFEMEEHTMAWFNTLPEHVQRAYRRKDSDQKYLEPTPIDEFREKNRTYIEKNSIDEHWEMMLDEILAEVMIAQPTAAQQASLPNGVQGTREGQSQDAVQPQVLGGQVTSSARGSSDVRPMADGIVMEQASASEQVHPFPVATADRQQPQPANLETTTTLQQVELPQATTTSDAGRTLEFGLECQARDSDKSS
eukprot:s1782_g4.t1